MELSNGIKTFMPYIAVEILKDFTNEISVLTYARIYGLDKSEIELLLLRISVKYSSIGSLYCITINKSQMIYGTAKYKHNGTTTKRHITIVMSRVSLADFLIFFDSNTHELLKPESIVGYEVKHFMNRQLKTYILHVKDIDNTFIVTGLYNIGGRII